MATYVNDLRLKEIATGDESGTWGTSTNTNLELIGEALGFGTEAITTNADTHTSTIADGATDPVRAMYVKYTGTLDSACTITIAPNTINRMQFIENGTSGSQNIIISQGSGANITIPPGDTKAVYLDGAGSGAAVVDAFASLSVVDLKVQDDLTVTDDMTVGGTLGVTGTVTLAGDIDLAGGIDVDGTSNLDIVDIDGAVDMASTLQVDGAITSSAGATITLADNTDNLTLTTTDADASVGPNLRMYRNSGSPADNDLVGAIDFEGRNDNSQDVVYSQIFTQILDASDGTEDGYLSFKVMNAGTSRQRLLFDAGETVFNDESQDVDFRVEGNGQANLFVVNAGSDDIGIGMATPTFSTGNGMQFADNFYLGFGTGNGTRPDFSIHGDNNGLGFACGTGSDDADVTISTAGAVGIGNTSPSFLIDLNNTTTSDNKTLAHFIGTASAGSATDDGGQFLSVSRNGPISQANGVMGGICFNGSSANGANARIQGNYKFNSGRDLQFLTTSDNSSAPAERMVIKGGGMVAIGTTSTGNRSVSILQLVSGESGLYVNNSGGTITSSVAPLAQFQFSGDADVGDGSKFMEFQRQSDTIGSITALGAAVRYNTSSDRNLKENIADASSQLNIIKNLQVREFDWKTNGRHDLGLIAQELHEHIPNVVTVGSNDKNSQGFTTPWAIDYGLLTPYLIKAVQELEARITTLEG